MPARVFNHGVPPQRIRTFLLFFAIALTTPLLVLAAYGLSRMANLERADIERRVLQVAEDLAHDIDREIDRASAILDTLSSSVVLRRNDLAAFDAQAKAALKREDAAIVLIDRQFQQVTSTMRAFGSTLPKTADIATARRAFETQERQISNLFRGSVDGQPVFNVEVPIIIDGTALYVLIMSFRASRIADLIRRPALGEPWVNGVTDNKGVILARSERHEEFVGQPLPADLLASSRAEKSVYRAKSVTGADIVRATVRSKNAGWLVSATVPLAYVEEPRVRGQLLATALLGTALALGLAFAYVFGGFMARPLAEATAAAGAVGAGKQIAPLHSPLREANTLTQALSEASLELKRRQDHADFLLRELAHRSKNQLAVVRGIALQTVRQSGSLETFIADFNRRLQGLAESQDLMLRQNWRGAWLKDLVEAHLNLFGAAARATMSGPQVFLDADAVQNIGFALNELATNASKHGVLNGADGTISVRWTRVQDRIHIEWAEEAVPRDAASPLGRISDGAGASPSSGTNGFGTLVLTKLVPQALQGQAILEFTRTGCRWMLDLPATYERDLEGHAEPSGASRHA